MKKFKIDNNDIVDFLNTVESLKFEIPAIEYRTEMRRYLDLELSTEEGLTSKEKKERKEFYSAHKEFRRLMKKKLKRLDYFRYELNPHSGFFKGGKKKISQLTKEDIEKHNIEYTIARKIIDKKSEKEIVELIIKQRKDYLIYLKSKPDDNNVLDNGLTRTEFIENNIVFLDRLSSNVEEIFQKKESVNSRMKYR